MKEIKIIDLLNIFKTDNQIPTKIKVLHGITWDYYKWDAREQWYVTYDDSTLLRIACPKDLFEEVEIIEDKEEILQSEDLLSFTLTDKVWTARQASELIDNFRKLANKVLKQRTDKEDKIDKLSTEYVYCTRSTMEECVNKINEIIDKVNNME